MTEDKIFEEATLAAFNLCCNWLAANGHAVAATALGHHLNGLDAPPAPIDLQPADTKRTIAVQQGFTGNQCSNCNSMHMKVSGHCEVCSDCGTTTGCS